jgi:hypothetical protein
VLSMIRSAAGDPPPAPAPSAPALSATKSLKARRNNSGSKTSCASEKRDKPIARAPHCSCTRCSRLAWQSARIEPITGLNMASKNKLRYSST